MPLNVDENPIWNFLKFKPVRVFEDGSIEEKEIPAEHPWETEKIRNLLNQITVSRTFTAEKKKYKYMVSEEKATVEEVRQLGSKVENIIKEHKFPSRGINYERHVMYSELFDELIRQVIIEHPDLGEILLQIRDHFRQEIYNYEQVYATSQVYGCRKQFMEKHDERLNELETEVSHLLKKQEKSMEKVDRVYEETAQMVLQCEDIEVDDFEYWRAVQFYQNYIKCLLYYFDLRAEEENIIQGLEDKQVEAEEEEQEQESEGMESFTLHHEKLEEEEEELPGDAEEEVQVEPVKQQKEEPVDKDLIYKENEEELYDSDVDTEQTYISEVPKSQDDVIPPSETDPAEQLQVLLEEELKHEISITDVAEGFMKKAYEEELKMIEEKIKLEEERKRQEELERLELEKAKQQESEMKRKRTKKVKTTDELGEEELEEEEEEEVEEEESLPKEKFPSLLDEDLLLGSPKRREGSFHTLKSDESEIDQEIPLLAKPKYALLRKLTNTLRCKDLIQRISDEDTTKKRRVKKVVVKKSKAKPQSPKPIGAVEGAEEIQKLPEAVTESLEESLTAVRASEFKWGLPLSDYFAQMGRNISGQESILRAEPTEGEVKNEEETEEVVTAPDEEIKDEPAPEEESELFSSGLTIGKTESSCPASTEESLSIDEEEEEKEVKEKEDQEEEEDDDGSILLTSSTLYASRTEKTNK